MYLTLVFIVCETYLDLTVENHEEIVAGNHDNHHPLPAYPRYTYQLLGMEAVRPLDSYSLFLAQTNMISNDQSMIIFNESQSNSTELYTTCICKAFDLSPAKSEKRLIDTKKLSMVFSWSGRILNPVVQSIVSLTSSLRGQLVKCFTMH